MRMIQIVLFFLFITGQVLAETSELNFVVPKDEALPIDELSLLLTPLTRDDLSEEIVLWQILLQEKLLIISEVQITMKYVNRDIQVFEGTQATLDVFIAASNSLNEHRSAAVEDTSQAAAEKDRELQQDLLESRFNMKDAVFLAIAREAKAIEAHNLEFIVKTALRSIALQESETNYEEFGNIDPGLANLKKEMQEAQIEFDPNNIELMGRVKKELAEILRNKNGVKNLLVEYLAIEIHGRDELVKRINMVMSEWEKKGAIPEDLAIYQDYLDDVTSFKLDVADQATRLSLLKLWLQSEAGGIRFAKNIGKFIGTLLVFVLLAILIGSLTSRALKRAEHVSQLMKEFIIRSIRRVIILFGFLTSLSLAGVNVGPILGVVGAAGFILAFALQNTLSNFASGIMIMMYKPFDVGDAIDASGVMGVVKTMNLTSTIINTFDNKMVIIPNNSIWGGVITNITGSKTRRVDLVFRISYGDDTDLAAQIINEVLAEQELILEEPKPKVKMHELSDFTVNFICRPWVNTTDYWDVRWELNQKIRARFKAAGFSAPVDPGGYIKRLGNP